MFCTFPAAIRSSAIVNGMLPNIAVKFQPLHFNMKKKNAVIENAIQEVLTTKAGASDASSPVIMSTREEIEPHKNAVRR